MALQCKTNSDDQGYKCLKELSRLSFVCWLTINLETILNKIRSEHQMQDGITTYAFWYKLKIFCKLAEKSLEMH